ncbi:hypothetical protein D9M69_271540 [compost metagenome]
MPSPLNTPVAGPVSKPPHLPEGGCLPRTPQDVAANRRLQNARYQQAWYQATDTAQRTCDSPPLPPCDDPGWPNLDALLKTASFYDTAKGNHPERRPEL